ncbi:MAG: hypothetical protein WB777_18700 [Mycobacterium sp.]
MSETINPQDRVALVAQPKEIAEVIAFLASEKAPPNLERDRK